jgi:hypothetical protein
MRADEFRGRFDLGAKQQNKKLSRNILQAARFCGFRG